MMLRSCHVRDCRGVHSRERAAQGFSTRATRHWQQRLVQHGQLTAATQLQQQQHQHQQRVQHRLQALDQSNEPASDIDDRSNSADACSDIDQEWQDYIRPHPQSWLPSASASWVSSYERGAASKPNAAASVDDWDFTDELTIPMPSNLPVNESRAHYDMWTLTDQPGFDMFQSRTLWRELSEVFVILFGVGERDQEGIYSLRALSQDGLPRETIIAFESEEDAQRYAALLEATMEHVPNVCSIPPQELLDFCTDAGYSCRLEPQGSLLIPPDYNVGMTDWERSLRLKEGKWSVLPSEPEPAGVAHSSSSSGGSSIGVGAAGSSRQARPGQMYTKYQEFSGDGLESIRVTLERLYHQPGLQEEEEGTCL